MRKIFIYLIILIQIIFLIPILFTKKFNVEETDVKIENNVSEQEIIENNYDYKKYSTIKLLHKDSGQVEEVALDDYLCNVVSAEMPADFSFEALKAQAVVARTYTIYKITTDGKKHDNADICDDSACCQAWITKEARLARWEENVRETNWNNIVNAVNSTKGKIGRGKDFFEEAFGSSVDEFRKILWMPETFIIYRRQYDARLREKLAERYTNHSDKDCDLANEWWDKFNALVPEKFEQAKQIIALNKFKVGEYQCDDADIEEVLWYYKTTRDDAEK